MNLTFSGRIWVHSPVAFCRFHKHRSERTSPFKIYEFKLPDINKPKVARLTRVCRCPNGGISSDEKFLWSNQIWLQINSSYNKPRFRANPNCIITLDPVLGWSWMENLFILKWLVLSHASIIHGFSSILRTCRACKCIDSDTCTACPFNSRKFVLFTHVKLLMSMDVFLHILWHEVGTSFLSILELWLQGKKTLTWS